MILQISTLLNSQLPNINFSKLIDTFLNPSVTFIIGILTVLLTRNANQSSTARERLDKVYHPLFISIEPLLYKSVNYDDVSSFLDKYYELEEKYSLLLTPRLRQLIRNLPKQKTPYSKVEDYNPWFEICKYISKDYDKLCRQAHLPVRSISYRLFYGQYSSKLSMVFMAIYLSMPAIIFATLLLVFVFPRLLVIFYIFCLCFYLIQPLKVCKNTITSRIRILLFISGYLIHRYPEIELIIRMYKITAIIILYLSPSYPAFSAVINSAIKFIPFMKYLKFSFSSLLICISKEAISLKSFFCSSILFFFVAVVIFITSLPVPYSYIIVP